MFIEGEVVKTAYFALALGRFKMNKRKLFFDDIFIGLSALHLLGRIFNSFSPKHICTLLALL